MPYATTTSYFSIIEILKQYCHIEDMDPAAAVHAKVIGRLPGAAGDTDRVMLPVLDLLGVLPDHATTAELDPIERRQRTHEAVKHLVLTASVTGPVCLIVEDLHWIDSETQAVLDLLVESIPASRVMLLVNYRPEYHHGWGAKTYYRQLQIDALSPKSAEQLGRALLGDDPSVQRLIAHLYERTDGNPFFLEECVRSLVDRGLLVGQRGAYRLTAEPAVEVPSTVQALLSARIGRLPASDQQLLQTAAVIGKDFPLGLLRAIAVEGADDLRQTLRRLVAAELIYETAAFPDPEYTFKHALTYEVAYNGVPPERRRDLHARVVTIIEKLYPDRLSEYVERLSHHAYRGECWGKAVTYLRQAGAKAAERTAHRDAVGFLDEAVKALEHVPIDPDGLRQAVDLRIEMRNSLYALGEYRRTFSRLREAEELARRLGDARRSSHVTSLLAHYFWVVGEDDRAIEAAENALASSRETSSRSIEWLTRQYLGLACVDRAFLLSAGRKHASVALRGSGNSG
jgi:predicted ATPase